jgi:hypothetical protein
MADVTVTAAQVSPLYPRFAEIYPVVFAETVTAGQILYQTSAGTFGVADANVAGKQQARGIATEGGGAGQGGSMLVRGHCAGFTVSQAYDAQLFLSDTAGAVADAAGTMSVPIARVVGTTDPSYTKTIYFDFSWNVQRS